MSGRPKALAVQVGGDHYKKGIQPFQLSLANGHDGCIHAIQKYLTRHARIEPKLGYLALQKAHHICMIRVECIFEFGVLRPERKQIEIDVYVESNSLDMQTANAVRLVEAWHNSSGCDHLARAEAIRATIRHLSSIHYPQFHKEEDFIA